MQKHIRKNTIHADFVALKRMSSIEFKSLVIRYSFANSSFGDILIASTEKGICYIAFIEDNPSAIANLKVRFPNARIEEKTEIIHNDVISFFQNKWEKELYIPLHLRGTDFQFKVWEELLEIPLGKLVSYGELAQKIGKPKAARAVGTAIGSNPIAFIVPCHRVVQASGKLGGYMWGSTRKMAIIAWEQEL